MEPSGKEEPPPRNGGRIAHYTIVGELGRGGSGIVYRAQDTLLDREVALKCVRPDRAVHVDDRRRLLREARAASRLSHPSIVTIFEVFEHEGVPWIAYELVDGMSLRAAIERRGRPPIDDILRHAEELADALRAAHAAGILHRDVSPNNILITHDGRARLTDFGLARIDVAPERISEATTRSEESEEGSVVGTPGYMSPECLLGKKVDARSDLFSLGAVLYEMCAGRPPFKSTSRAEMTDAVLHRDPVSMARLNDEVPAELERIVRKAMAKRAEERYQDARDMVADVRALRRLRDSGAVPIAEDHARSTRGAWPTLIVAAALLMGGGVLLWRIRAASAPQRSPAGVPRQLTAGINWEADPALSPDGEFVAYAAQGVRDSDIWMIDVRGGEPLRLTDDPATDRDPCWFPDGSAVAFVSNRNGEDAIWKVPRLGGSAVLLVPDANDPAVSPDGSRIAFTRADSTGAARIFVAALVDASNAQALTGRVDGLAYLAHPAWSPDGRSLCFQDMSDLWVVTLDGARPRPLTSDHAWGRDPAWSADGRFVYYSSLREGTRAIWRVDAQGGTPERVTLGTGPEGQPSVARKGSRLAYSTLVDRRQIVILDRKTGARARQASLWKESAPVFMPDGGALLFTSNRQGRFDLWSQVLQDGRAQGEARRLTDHPGSVATIAVSPDALWLAYHRSLEGQRDIWTLPSRGGIPFNFSNDPAADVQPAFSPDGSKLAFVSNRDGDFHVWVERIAQGRPAGPAARLTSRTGSERVPAWSPDGSRIAFVGHEESGSDVWIATVVPGATAQRVTSGAHAALVHWEPGKEALLVSGTWKTAETQIRRVAVPGIGAEPFVPPVVFGSAAALGDFSLSLDGRYLAYVEEEVRGNIWVLEAPPHSY